MVSCQTPVPRLVQRVAIIIKYERLVDINELIEEHVGEQGRQGTHSPLSILAENSGPTWVTSVLLLQVATPYLTIPHILEEG